MTKLYYSFNLNRSILIELFSGLAKKSLGKKKEDEEAIKAFSNMAAFANYLRELESLAAQHEVGGLWQCYYLYEVVFMCLMNYFNFFNEKDTVFCS